MIDVALSGHTDPQILEEVRDGAIVLRATVNGASVDVLAEREWVVSTDVRDHYLDEQGALDIRAEVFRLGSRAGARVPVLVSRYGRDRALSERVAVLTTDATGTVQLSLRAQVPGFATYRLEAFASGTAEPVAPPRLDTTNDAYVNVRTLPFDDALERATTDDQLTWTFIYERVLQVYDVINPVMARPAISAPLNDAQTMIALAQRIKDLTASVRLEGIGYMPITRDMSAGRRRLLHRWCDLVINGMAPDIARAEMLRTLEPDFRTARDVG